MWRNKSDEEEYKEFMQMLIQLPQTVKARGTEFSASSLMEKAILVLARETMRLKRITDRLLWTTILLLIATLALLGVALKPVWSHLFNVGK